ncbi:MAG TPA: mycothiol conjugate amidase Mca, partial [Actinobacteria bacterium]|nr:mycothiol conjugate amidase Mca [Actinomycetota bacterium]
MDPMDRRLLALHAHPDDESSKGAGTVARYAEEGVRCVLVTATGGEAGDVLNPRVDPEVRDRLADVRRGELMEAARILGYDEVILLGYRDSGMPGTPENRHPDALVNADCDEVLARIVAIVRRERPQVLLGYDRHEFYPHPDHLCVHRLALEAFEAAADPDRFPEAGPAWEVTHLYAPVFSRRRIETLHRALSERGLDSPFGPWLTRLGPDADDGKILLRVDVSDRLETARAALRAHRTQVDPEGFWFQVPA